MWKERMKMKMKEEVLREGKVMMKPVQTKQQYLMSKSFS